MAPVAMSMAKAARSEASDEAQFVADVRAFLERALTENLREAGRATIGVHADISACRIWHRRLFERGWIAPAWPRAWGGAGWGPRLRFLFDRECAANDAPILFAGGLRSVGPLLIEMGTPRQRSRYLPAILSGDDLWCQGFSEPGARSTWRPFPPAPSAKTITMWSTDPKFGPPALITPTACSRSSAPGKASAANRG